MRRRSVACGVHAVRLQVGGAGTRDERSGDDLDHGLQVADPVVMTCRFRRLSNA